MILKRFLIFLLSLTIGVQAGRAQFAAFNFTLVSNINPEPGFNADGDKYSACWGWTHPVSGKEFAIACSKSGTYWVDISNPATPTVSAFAAGTSSSGVWREVKTYQNYCYVICDDANSTGFQIFDMSNLPTSITLVSSNSNLFKRGHTCWVDGNKLYVSSVTYSDNTISSLDVYSLANPAAPVLLRKLGQDYPNINTVHDAYARRDTVFASCAYQGLYVYKFNTTTNTFGLLGSLLSYPYSGYNHSSQLTPNGRTLVFTDEVPSGLPLKVADVTNLSNIQIMATANQFSLTTPHNPFMYNNQYCFMSAYQDGTQLWDISNPSSPYLAGYFDTYPQGGGNNNTWNSANIYDGQWGMYPYFASGNIFALDELNGIFIFRTSAFSWPEIDIKSNSKDIFDGSTATSTVNNTSFGNVLMGSSLSHTFQIINDGSGTLTVSSYTISGTNASDFSLTAPALPLTLTASAAVVFTINFTPTVVGTRNAKVTFTNSDVNEGIYDFNISGKAITTAGINEHNGNIVKLSIQPNPANSEIIFTTGLALNEKEIALVIYDAQGKIVSVKKNNSIYSKGSLRLATSVTELDNGLYYVELLNGSSVIARNKLVISK